MSVPDQGQGESELKPYASASQGPWVTDQCGTGFQHTSLPSAADDHIPTYGCCWAAAKSSLCTATTTDP